MKTHHPAPPSGPLTRVATVLTPEERIRVDAAGEGLYRSIHRDSVEDALLDIRESRASAVVLSVTCCERTAPDRVAMVVREFPRVPTLALLSELGPRTPETLLSLGISGVRRLVDVRNASGWRSLRNVLSSECGDNVETRMLQALARDLEGTSHDCWEFFQALFLSPTSVTTVRRLCDALGVLPSTLMSKFFRARLPAPKRYLSMARLVKAAWLFENRGFSVANVSNHLEYSSPQSFGRHVRIILGVTAAEFRMEFDGARMIDRFRADMIAPHIEGLRRLAPLSYRR